MTQTVVNSDESNLDLSKDLKFQGGYWYSLCYTLYINEFVEFIKFFKLVSLCVTST